MRAAATMFLGILFIAAALLAVPLLGGRLGRLGDLRFSSPELGLMALGLQALVLGVFPEGDRTVHAIGHVASYVLMGVFVARNLAIPGVGIIALGGALNALAIIANDGVMPADPEAVRRAGLEVPAGEFLNSAPNADARLGFLGDVFATPAGWPLANVFSVGDVVLVIGVTWLVARWCRTWPAVALERLAVGLAPHRPRFELLRETPAFRRLWIAQFISNLGDWVYPVAVFTAAVGTSAATATGLSFLIMAQVGPGMLVGLFGGPIIDRFDRRTVMILSDAARLAAVSTLLLRAHPSLAHLYAVAVTLGVFGALFQPSFHASLPNLVRRDQLAAANALVGATFSAAIMLGPMIGALLIGYAGVGLGFAVNALSFAASAVLVAATHIPRGERRRAPRSLAYELRAGLGYMYGNRMVRGVLAVVALVTLAAGIKSPLEPILALRVLDGGPTAYGLLGGFWGAGMAIGFLVAAGVVRRLGHGRLLTGAILVVAAAVFLASGAPALWPIMGLWLCAGAANTLGTVAYETLLLERTPDAYRGRVMAAVEGALEAGLLVGVASAGLVASLAGVRGGFVVSGCVFLVAAFVAHRTVAVRERRTVPRCAGVELVPASARLALLRVRLAGAPAVAPVLLVDDGSRVHRLAPLPMHDPGEPLGYSVPRELLRRGAFALQLGAGELLDLPRPRASA
jgi:MFS family permease